MKVWAEVHEILTDQDTPRFERLMFAALCMFGSWVLTAAVILAFGRPPDWLQGAGAIVLALDMATLVVSMFGMMYDEWPRE